MHKRAIGHRLIDVTEGISQHLELLAVGGDRDITLNQIVKFSIKVNGVTLHVVLEDFLGGNPESMSRLLGLHDDVENIIRDGAIVPSEDCEVLLNPNGDVRVRRSVVNVLKERKFAEHGGEEHPPLCVI